MEHAGALGSTRSCVRFFAEADIEKKGRPLAGSAGTLNADLGGTGQHVAVQKEVEATCSSSL